jgi:hypothetical protein
MLRNRRFPFVPKSSVKLEPGDFWSIPLAERRYACGRVLESMPDGMPGARVGFLGGLMAWAGTDPPSYASIAGAGTVEQGVMHILSITQTGGAVLGNRPLELDRVEPWLFIHGVEIQRGFKLVRRAKPGDAAGLPALSWWGYDVVEVLARKHFMVER